jgi:N-acetylglucosamine repressor
MKKSTQEDSKLHNSRLILRTIYEQGEISRVDVSRQTGLTRTTVSEVVGRFIQEGLVSETGISPSRGGKPAILLSLVDDAQHLIGVDLANSEFRGAIVNLRGKVIQSAHLPVQDRDGEAALGLVYTLIEGLLALAQRPILGIGIGTPGLMDPQRGVVRQAVNLDWYNLPLGDLLRQRFQLPIYIANDSQAAALAEYTFNNKEKKNNLVVVKAGRGIGSGIVLDGKLFFGDHAGAGEIGHVKIIEGGERCRCGNYGCLETVASSRAILRRTRQAMAEGRSALLSQLVSEPEEIDNEVALQALHAGDESVRCIVEEAGRYLGTVIAHMVVTLNIQHIIIAGSLAQYGEPLTRSIKEQVDRGALAALAHDTHISTSTLGREIVILGAASLILSNEAGLA